MKRAPETGSILIMGILIVVLLTGAILVVLESGRWRLRLQAQRDALDAVVLSALRVKVQGLQNLAARLEELGKNLGAAEEGVIALSGMPIGPFQESTQSIRRSLSGYQGRITSILKVAAEANGLAREQFDPVGPEDFRMGVEPRSAWIRTEDGGVHLTDAAWYARTWTKNDQSAVLHRRVETPLPFLLRSAARLRWDAKKDGGTNGGFPKNWEDAVHEGKWKPYRYPIFRAEVSNEAD